MMSQTPSHLEYPYHVLFRWGEDVPEITMQPGMDPVLALCIGMLERPTIASLCSSIVTLGAYFGSKEDTAPPLGSMAIVDLLNERLHRMLHGMMQDVSKTDLCFALCRIILGPELTISDVEHGDILAAGCLSRSPLRAVFASFATILQEMSVGFLEFVQYTQFPLLTAHMGYPLSSREDVLRICFSDSTLDVSRHPALIDFIPIMKELPEHHANVLRCGAALSYPYARVLLQLQEPLVIVEEDL